MSAAPSQVLCPRNTRCGWRYRWLQVWCAGGGRRSITCLEASYLTIPSRSLEKGLKPPSTEGKLQRLPYYLFSIEEAITIPTGLLCWPSDRMIFMLSAGVVPSSTWLPAIVRTVRGRCGCAGLEPLRFVETSIISLYLLLWRMFKACNACIRCDGLNGWLRQVTIQRFNLADLLTRLRTFT